MFNFKNSKFSGSIRFANLVLATSLAGGVLLVQSPTASGFSIEEVVVTARKREESIQDVPVAITAVSAEVLESFGTTDMLELQKYAPGVQIERGDSGGGGTISMRGISTTPTNVGFSQTVSMVIDGVQIERPRILTMGMVDLAQIEVMRGPQSLFFGKNSPAGAISLKSADPTDQFEGSFTVNYETEAKEAKVLGSISGPLTDSLGARLALSYRDMAGDFKNTAFNRDYGSIYPGALAPLALGLPAEPEPTLRGEELGGEEEIVGRLVFEYAPDEGSFDARLGISYSDHTNDGPSKATQVIHCAGGGVDQGLPNQDLDGNGIADLIDPVGDCEADDRKPSVGIDRSMIVNWPSAESEPYHDVEQTLVTLTWNYTFDYLNLTGVTGYYDLDSQFLDEFTFTSFGNIVAAEGEQYEALSQEFRLASDLDGPFNFMAGLYYQDTTMEFHSTPKVASLGPDPTNGGSYFTFSRIGEAEGETLSAFLELQYDINDQWAISGGARWTEEEKKSFVGHAHTHVVTGAFCAQGVVAFCPPPNGLQFLDDQKDREVNPELTLAYQPNANVNLFASYRTGFKSGGMSLSGNSLGYVATEDGTPTGTPLTGAALAEFNRMFEEGATFEPEEVDGFEVGFKYSNDQGFTLNGAIYRYEYTNLQVSSFNEQTLGFDISNAAEATTQGIELDSSYVSENLLVYGSLSYSDAEFDSYPGAACYANQSMAQGCVDGTQDLGGQRLARAPEWTGNVGFNWTANIGDQPIILTGNIRYSDESRASEDGNPNAIQDAYTIYDAGVRVPLNVSEQEVTLALYGRNLSDERYFTTSSNTPGAVVGTLHGVVSRGRQVVLEVSTKF